MEISFANTVINERQLKNFDFQVRFEEHFSEEDTFKYKHMQDFVVI